MSIRWFISYVVVVLCLLIKTLIAQPNFDVVSVELEKSEAKVNAGTDFRLILFADIDIGYHINSNKPRDKYLIPVTISSDNDLFPISKVTFPEPEEVLLPVSPDTVSIFTGKLSIAVTLKISKNIKPGIYQVPIEINYQACKDVSCLPPNSTSVQFEVIVSENREGGIKENEPQNRILAKDSIHEKEISLADIKNQNLNNKNKTVRIEHKDSGSVASTLEASGLLLSLIFIFLAGLGLNLTPCVYPLIPITIGYFGGQAEGKTSRLFILGLLYMLGMALTYSVIGVITSLSGAVFGTLLQNPFIIIGIAFLFVVLALSQFGVYEFKLPDTIVAKAGGAKGGIYGAFFMGLTMGIVAAPCIGPFVLGLVTYVAAKGDPYHGFLMFFVLALGLGFPYLLLAVFSGKIKNLPRAGIWMEGVKHIFGFLLIGMAFYFLDPILPKSIQGYLLPIFGIIVAIILLFIDKTTNSAKGFRNFKTMFSFIVLAVSIYSLIPKERLEPEWQKFSLQSYEASLKKNERMVIDFYADWCIPCKELDALTFSDPRIIKVMERFTTYKVDMTQTTQENEELKKKFGIVGMPTILIINSKGKGTNRLAGFVKADKFLELIKNVD